jgi:hypothetical protein
MEGISEYILNKQFRMVNKGWFSNLWVSVGLTVKSSAICVCERERYYDMVRSCRFPLSAPGSLTRLSRIIGIDPPLASIISTRLAHLSMPLKPSESRSTTWLETLSFILCFYFSNFSFSFIFLYPLFLFYQCKNNRQETRKKA